MQQFGSVGDVIRNNSAFKFYLESAYYPKARQHNLLQVDDFGLAMLNSVKTMKPRYSEIFMETPFGTGVARLSVDPYSYYVFTSDPREIAEIDALLAAGARYEDAIHTMVERHHHGRS
jgi:conjugal transfer ATP-binding protein TraC